MCPKLKRMSDWMDELERLAELRDKGLLSDEEFEVKRQEIINVSSKEEILWPPQDKPGNHETVKVSRRNIAVKSGLIIFMLLAVIGIIAGVLISQNGGSKEVDIVALSVKVEEYLPADFERDQRCRDFKITTEEEFIANSTQSGYCESLDIYIAAYDEKLRPFWRDDWRKWTETSSSAGAKCFLSSFKENSQLIYPLYVSMEGDRFGLQSDSSVFSSPEEFGLWIQLAKDIGAESATLYQYDCNSRSVIRQNWGQQDTEDQDDYSSDISFRVNELQLALPADFVSDSLGWGPYYCEDFTEAPEYWLLEGTLDEDGVIDETNPDYPNRTEPWLSEWEQFGICEGAQILLFEYNADLTPEWQNKFLLWARTGAQVKHNPKYLEINEGEWTARYYYVRGKGVAPEKRWVDCKTFNTSDSYFGYYVLMTGPDFAIWSDNSYFTGSYGFQQWTAIATELGATRAEAHRYDCFHDRTDSLDFWSASD